MTQEQLIDNLGIIGERGIEDGNLVVTSTDSNLYSNWYSILDKSELIEVVPEKTVMDMDEVELTFVSDNHEITLKGDFEKNVYKLIVKDI